MVQVCFKDSSEIILNAKEKYVSYVNKSGEHQLFALSAALEGTDSEITKRLKYIKSILTSIVPSKPKEPESDLLAKPTPLKSNDI